MHSLGGSIIIIIASLTETSTLFFVAPQIQSKGCIFQAV